MVLRFLLKSFLGRVLICVLVFYYRYDSVIAVSWQHMAVSCASTVKSITEEFEIVQMEIRLQNSCANVLLTVKLWHSREY